MTKSTTALPTELFAFFRLIGAGPHSVLVGVSGGADSVALLYLLHEYREKLGIERLGVAHVNHGLRGEESDGDEDFVRDIAMRLQLEFFRIRLNRNEIYTPHYINGSLSSASSADSNDAGIEDWARRERYNFFHETTRNYKFDYIATAHTANDQAETLLMRLARGTGVRGLRGILPVRGDGVIRPLLEVERWELEEWLVARGLSYRTDSTNADVKYRRNFVRSRIIPLLSEGNSGAVSNIAACARSVARAWEIVGAKVGEWVVKYVTRINNETFHIDREGLRDDIVAPEALLVLFEEYGISVSRLHIDRVIRSVELSGIGGSEHLLPDGWKFYVRKDRVCFVCTYGNR